MFTETVQCIPHFVATTHKLNLTLFELDWIIISGHLKTNYNEICVFTMFLYVMEDMYKEN